MEQQKIVLDLIRVLSPATSRAAILILRPASFDTGDQDSNCSRKNRSSGPKAMVYSGGVRSFLQTVAVFALVVSALPSVQARENVQAKTVTCDVSDGDKRFGIQAISDTTCKKGGLGCFNKSCRYCKVLDTPKSSYLDTCASHGVVFTSTATVPVTQGPCDVSSGDVAAGISAVADSGCLYGGLGCYNDHCRFCKVSETPQSAGFMACSNLDKSYSATVDTVAPATSPVVGLVTVAPTVATVATTEAPTVAVTDTPKDAPTSAPTEAPGTQTTCTIVPSAGDLEGGVTIVTDPLCVSGGIGCLSDVCRFCKLKTTPQSDPYMDCALVNTTTALGTDAPVSTATVPLSTTATPVIETELSTGVPGDVTTEAPVTPTESPAPTSPDLETEAPFTEVPIETVAPQTMCTLVASAGDAEVGISVATDPSCSLGGLGCIDEICRFCKTTTTIQSAPYLDCALIEGGSPKSEMPAADVTSSSPVLISTETPSASTTETPVVSGDTTESPVIDAPDVTTTAPVVNETPDASTEAPVFIPVPTTISTSPETETCGIVAAAGDIAVGVHIETDATCSAGGVGCINDLCRFCKVETTPQSAAFVDCSALTVDTAAPATTIPVATPASCDLVASTGDAAVGIRVVTDSTCSVGGIGCISDVCRFCKVITSIQSATFIDCVTVDGYTPETEAPAVATTPDVTASIPASEATCDRIASEGDLAVGVSIATDDTCRSGGVGCIDDVCRFCQVTDTLQSAAFVNCTTLPGYTPRSEAPADVDTTPPSVPTTDAPVAQTSCDLVVSAGDAAVGISITGDATCAAGGVGCIDSVCRFCKVTTTVQSAAFVDCTSIAGFMLDSDVPVDTTPAPADSTTATTSAPAVSCGLVVSEGDAAVGIDITADAACQFGGVGCIDSVCRFCKVKTTEQSAAFVDCPVSLNGPALSTSVPSITTPAPSDAIADASDALDSTDSSSIDDSNDVSTTEGPAVIVDASASHIDVPQDDDTSDEIDSSVEGSGDYDDNFSTVQGPDANGSPTEAPAGTSATDSSDLLTQAPAATTEAPTAAPVQTDDDYDNWEGSDESGEADSDSGYFDDAESTDGI